MVDEEARAEVRGLAAAFKAHLEKSAKEQAERQKKEIIEGMAQVQSMVYERASAYMNLILLGGYAGIFTVWTNTASSLPKSANVLVGVSLGISLLAFVLFEVYKMVVTSAKLLQAISIIRSKAPPEEFAQQVHRAVIREKKPSITLIPIWITCVFVSLSGALFAVSLLFYNYMATFTEMPKWPSDSPIAISEIEVPVGFYIESNDFSGP